MSYKVFSSEYLDRLCASAQCSPRQRMHSNIHENYQDLVQKLFNAIGIDSYIRPHKHSIDTGDELLVGVRGRMALVIFDNAGNVTDVSLFGQPSSDSPLINIAVELPSSVWHTVVALDSVSVLFEVKKGPFDPKKAKDFAPWAPDEDSATGQSYLSKLRETIFSLMQLSQ